MRRRARRRRIGGHGVRTRTWLIALLPFLGGCGVALGGTYGGGHPPDAHGADVRYGGYYDHAYARRVSYGRLPVPRGHLPPPGSCRVWLPGVPPGHQPAPGSCAVLERRVPPGGWLLVRPYRYPGVVELLAYDHRRPGVRIRYVYDAGNGRRLRY